MFHIVYMSKATTCRRWSFGIGCNEEVHQSSNFTPLSGLLTRLFETCIKCQTSRGKTQSRHRWLQFLLPDRKGDNLDHTAKLA